MTPTTTDHIRTVCSITITFLLAVILWVEWPTSTPVGPPAPPPGPTVDATALGRTYGATLSATYATAWEAAAKDVDGGKSIEDAQADLQSTWQTARTTAFNRDVAPAFAAIVPEGAAGDATSRPKWSKAARDLAAGLRSVK